MTKRQKIGRMCVYLSGLFKWLGNRLLNKSCVIDVLIIPGFYIIDDFLIYQSPSQHRFFKHGTCFEWRCYEMPEIWSEKLKEMKDRHGEL